MTDLERFWLDLMDGRRYIINEVYGNEAMLRYRPHPKEKEYFFTIAYHHPEISCRILCLPQMEARASAGYSRSFRPRKLAFGAVGAERPASASPAERPTPTMLPPACSAA